MVSGAQPSSGAVVRHGVLETQLWDKAAEVSCFAFHCGHSLPLKFSSVTPLPVTEADSTSRLAHKEESEWMLGPDQRWGRGRQAPAEGALATTKGDLRGEQERGVQGLPGP